MLNRLSLNKLSLNRIDLNRIGGRDVGVSARPYIDPELLSHVKMAISTWGKSNDDPDRTVLKDLSGNGNDMRLLNFGFAEGSGYGLYGTDTEMGKKVYGDTDSIELNDIYGYSFVYANSETTLNDVELRRTNRGFREPVWIIGDSYCSTDNNERWPYYLLNEYKIKSWFLIALAGQTSNDLNGHVGAYNDLLNALQYGTPKYLWYQIQANDTNAVYEEYIYKIKDICDKRGITLILVRHAKLGEQAEGKDWQTKNSIALSLGLRYVDMYKAVTGNELTHDWYEGYLSSDGVHPTALGAKAEAMRILCDIPEITQYN